MTALRTSIVSRFDAAAPRYDAAASLQKQVAKKLVVWAAEKDGAYSSILDIGCGTGLVAQELYRGWPCARITAMDAAPAMLREAKCKMPNLNLIEGDAASTVMPQKFDAIFSSMALHWLPRPDEALRLWQSWLNPGGSLFVAFPAEGSFPEWRALCQSAGVADGLWPLPHADVAADIATRRKTINIVTSYPTARDFLHSIKAVGASTPRMGHVPINISAMRRLFSRAPGLVTATCRIVLAELPAFHAGR